MSRAIRLHPAQLSFAAFFTFSNSWHLRCYNGPARITNLFFYVLRITGWTLSCNRISGAVLSFDE